MGTQPLKWHVCDSLTMSSSQHQICVLSSEKLNEPIANPSSVNAAPTLFFLFNFSLLLIMCSTKFNVYNPHSHVCTSLTVARDQPWLAGCPSHTKGWAVQNFCVANTLLLTPKGSNVPPLRSPVVDEERTRPGQWSGSVICISFNALSDEVLAWLSVCSEVQMICTWSNWCHSHPTISCFIKIQIGLTFLPLPYPGCPGKRGR